MNTLFYSGERQNQFKIYLQLVSTCCPHCTNTVCIDFLRVFGGLSLPLHPPLRLTKSNWANDEDLIAEMSLCMKV